MRNATDLDKNPDYLLYQLKYLREILCAHEKPWEGYLPMLHHGFVLYYDQLGNEKERANAMVQSLQMISFASEMIRKRRFIDGMIKLLTKQIEEIKAI